MNYLIEAKFLPKHLDDKSKTEFYQGTMEDLEANIATTWSQIPHTKKYQTEEGSPNLIIRVWDNTKGRVVALFTCVPLTSYQPLPGHF